MPIILKIQVLNMFFKDDKKAAYPLDFETVYATAGQCDYWRILLPEPIGYDKQSLATEDPRYTDFQGV